MKIYFITFSKIPSIYANTVHIMQMGQAFANNNHDVTLFAKRGDWSTQDDFQYYGVKPSFKIKKFTLHPNKILTKVFYVLDVVRCICREKERPDILYFVMSYCMFFLKSLKVPMVFEAHVSPANIIEKCMLDWIFRRDNFIRLVVISDSLKKEYLRIYPYLKNKNVIVAHDGANIADANKNVLKSMSKSLFNENLKVGYVGSLYHGRGIDLIIRLSEILPQFDFHIVGGTENEVCAWKRKVSNSKNLHFHGHVQPSDVLSYEKMFDILLAPYQSVVAGAGNKGNTVRWMSPMKLFEYMSAGKAIVSSDLPTIREVLNDNVDALLVDPEDMDAWQQAIKKLEDPNLRVRLGCAAKKKLESQFTWQKRAEAVLKNLDS